MFEACRDRLAAAWQRQGRGAMKILVTGGAGFIGTHLCRRLLADGHALTVVDNESTGSRDNLDPAIRFVRGDVSRQQDMEAVFAGGLDAVCHIAGQVSIIRSFSDPVVDLRTNVEGTLNVLQLCVKHRVPRLLYASSMTLYGDIQTVPTPESEPCRPDSYYGITKHAAERYVHSTAERPDLDFEFAVTSLRMFSVYGPGQSFSNPYQGVLGIFSGNILRGEPIRIFGDGEQTRDFVFVGDIVDGWATALGNPRAKGEVINLGSGRSRSINQLAASVIAAFGYSEGGYPIERMPARPGEQRTVQADITRAGAILNWKPNTSFEEGLAQTVNWAKSEFAAGNEALVKKAAR
jgi:UDP-glucose 4-epimerase